MPNLKQTFVRRFSFFPFTFFFETFTFMKRRKILHIYHASSGRCKCLIYIQIIEKDKHIQKKYFQLANNIFKMCLTSILVIVIYLIPVRTVPLTIYNNAWFHPTNMSYQLINLSSASTLNMCACQCYNYSLCVTGTYFGNNQTCVLFSAYLAQGQLQPASNALTNVFSFPNRTIEIGK